MSCPPDIMPSQGCEAQDALPSPPPDASRPPAATKGGSRGRRGTVGTMSWIVIVVWVANTLPLIAWLTHNDGRQQPRLPFVRHDSDLSRAQRMHEVSSVANLLVCAAEDAVSFMIPQDHSPRADEGFAAVLPLHAAELDSLPDGARALATAGYLDVPGSVLDLVLATSIQDAFMGAMAVAGLDFAESMLERRFPSPDRVPPSTPSRAAGPANGHGIISTRTRG